ncbi:hypothetical protein BH23GEM7_BH23GEM7_00070 [soil metagenome]
MAGTANRLCILALPMATLCLLFAAPAASQQRGERAPSGMMWIEMPQVQSATSAGVRIHLAVETAATSARGAIAANDLARTRVLRVLATMGIAAVEVEEIGLTLLPEYAPREIVPGRTVRGTQPRTVGFLAVRRLSLYARDAAHAALLIDLAQGAGASLIAADVR